MSVWLPTIDGVDIKSVVGHMWPDGWISREVTLTCVARADITGVELRGWNPDWNAVYAGNQVSLAVDGESSLTGALYMGEQFTLRLAKSIPAGQPFVIHLESRAARASDTLDARERGVVMTQLAVLAAI